MTLPAEEALYLGAPLAHVAAYRERGRLARIDARNREAARAAMRRPAFNVAEAGMRALHDAPLASLDRSYARLMASFPKAGETM